MKYLATRSLFALALAALLTACGGSADGQLDNPVQTAALMGNETVQPDQAAQPQPDCAPEGCNGLRIINSNAEAYRLQAMERAQQEAAAPQDGGGA